MFVPLTEKVYLNKWELTKSRWTGTEGAWDFLDFLNVVTIEADSEANKNDTDFLYCIYCGFYGEVDPSLFAWIPS